MMKRVLILVVFMLFAANISAQESRSSRPSAILEVEAFLSSLRAGENNSRGTGSVAAHVESLIYDIQPAVYLDSRGVRVHGDNPNSLFTDPVSLRDIAHSNISKSNIEIVTIRINSNSELGSAIDLSSLSDFPKLKYVYILSSVKTTGDAIRSSVKNTSDKFSVFYKIAIGS